MSNGYLPASEADLNQWLTNFSEQLGISGTSYGLTADEVEATGQLITDFSAAYASHLAARESARAACAAKNNRKESMLDTVRAIVARLQAFPSMTDAARALYGITIPSPGPTPAPVPATRPVGLLDIGERLRHTLKVVDFNTPSSTAKPSGVIGCEIWMKIGGTPPVDPSETTLVAVHTNHQFTREFPGSDGGKPAHYMLRWVNPYGETGPWSETLTATIAA